MNTSFGDAAGHHPFSLSSRISKRDGRGVYRTVTFLTIFAMLFGGLLLLAPTSAGAQSTATTTAYLNLRTGPSTSDSIITTMPAGASVTITGSLTGEFYPLTYNGYAGFAHSDWISVGGSSAAPGGTTSGGATGTAYVTASALNLRSGPNLGSSVITVMPRNATVQLTGESGNGFLGVVYNGTSGFASAQYLSTSGSSSGNTGSVPVTGDVVGTATVNVAALNLRSGPSTGHSVVAVMSRGATVSLTSDRSNGFVGVTYNGTSGYAFAEYLSSGSTSAPAPSPAPGSGSVAVGDTVVDTAAVRASLNMRTGPATSYSVVMVIPSGANVDIMGSAQDGFYPVRYNGVKGWSSGDWLTIGATSPTPPPASSGNTDIIAIIYAAADRYGQPREDMLRVARCESVLDPNAINPYSNASGLFQFLPSTWATTPYANQDIFNAEANANAAAWMWSVGRRNEWVCQ